jgi:hypothetical protein
MKRYAEIKVDRTKLMAQIRNRVMGIGRSLGWLAIMLSDWGFDPKLSKNTNSELTTIHEKLGQWRQA